MNEIADAEGSMIIELRPLGQALEVAAVDEMTGTEVRFMVPVSTPREAIQRLAARKLAYVLNKRQ